MGSPVVAGCFLWTKESEKKLYRRAGGPDEKKLDLNQPRELTVKCIASRRLTT